MLFKAVALVPKVKGPLLAWCGGNLLLEQPATGWRHLGTGCSLSLQLKEWVSQDMKNGADGLDWTSIKNTFTQVQDSL